MAVLDLIFPKETIETLEIRREQREQWQRKEEGGSDNGNYGFGNEDGGGSIVIQI